MRFRPSGTKAIKQYGNILSSPHIPKLSPPYWFQRFFAPRRVFISTRVHATLILFVPYEFYILYTSHLPYNSANLILEVMVRFDSCCYFFIEELGLL